MRLHSVIGLVSGLLFVVLVFTFGFLSVDCREINKREAAKSWGQWISDWAKVENWKMPDFGKYLKPSAEKAPQELVKFYFFNKNNMLNPETFQLYGEDPAMFKGFDPKKTTKIIVHGWMGSVEKNFVKTMVNAYLPAFDYNVIVVDWSPKAQKFYPEARQSVPLIGKMLADFMEQLCKTYSIKPENLHVIGHSLGAHVSGTAGKFITIGKLARITGLDPAYPLFAEDHNDRLKIDSAKFVDVIHTCGKYLGWFDRIGHADFYPNKGIAIQPGCGADVLGKCSHRRAWQYYAESVAKPNLFIAGICDTWDNYIRRKCKGKSVSMGEYLPHDTKGIYYLETNENEPFARANA